MWNSSLWLNHSRECLVLPPEGQKAGKSLELTSAVPTKFQRCSRDRTISESHLQQQHRKVEGGMLLLILLLPLLKERENIPSLWKEMNCSKKIPQLAVTIAQPNKQQLTGADRNIPIWDCSEPQGLPGPRNLWLPAGFLIEGNKSPCCKYSS